VRLEHLAQSPQEAVSDKDLRASAADKLVPITGKPAELAAAR